MPKSIVEISDCMIKMKEFPDNAAYQRHLYSINKSKPEFVEAKRQAAKRSYRKNKEKINARSRQYRLKNLDRYNKIRNDWRTKSPIGIFEVIKQSAKRRSLHVEMTANDFVVWYDSQVRECYYCKRSESDVLKDTDVIQKLAKRLTVDRRNNSVGYKSDNLVLCCRRCNTIKGNFFTEDEMLEVGKIINRKFNVQA